MLSPNDNIHKNLTDFKGTIRQKRYLGVFTHPIAKFKKYENPHYIKKTCHVLVVNEYADTRFSNFAINIFVKTKKFAQPFLIVHKGPTMF